MQHQRPELAGLLAPLSAQAPCGTDLARDPAFIRLKRIATQGLGLAPGISDWAKVFDLGRSLLETKSKDLRITCYLAVAWLHRDGGAGAVAGLTLISQLVRAYPEELHPRAKRGRVVGRDRALAWYVEQLQIWMDQNEAGSLSPEHQAQCKTWYEQLAQTPAFALGQAQEIAAGLKRALTPKKVSQAPAPTPPSTKAPVPAEGTTAPPLDLRQLCSIQRRLACELQAQDPLDPISFRLLRQSLWTPILQLCTSQSRAIKLPSRHERQSLEDHLRQKRWPGLLERSEELLLQYPLCLDLQRFSVMALDGLSPGALAKQAILSELAALLHQLPTLMECYGINDEPLAAAKTRAWIQSQLHLQTPASASPKPCDKPHPNWRASIEDARQAPTAQLLEKIQAALDQAPDGRNYVKRALSIAQSSLPVPGLALLLVNLAVETLGLGRETILDRELEQQCVQQLLKLRQPAGQPKGQQCPETKQLTLALARRSLALALPYYQPA